MTDPMSKVWSTTPVKPVVIDDVNINLAVATLILGVVSVAMSIALTGVVFGLLGVILGIACLAGENNGKTMAGWGLGLSVLGILAGCFFGLIYLSAYAQQNADIASLDVIEQQTPEKWINQEAPDFTTTDVDGNRIILSELLGRRIVLNLWSPSELRCRDAIDYLIQLRNAIPEENVVIIGISKWAQADEVRDIGRKLGINYSLVSDDKLPSPYNDIFSQPTTIFIDQNGIIENIFDQYHTFDKLHSHAVGSIQNKSDIKVHNASSGDDK